MRRIICMVFQTTTAYEKTLCYWSSDACCSDLLLFKQKTAYEIRISDWSSDVCSSELFYIHHTPDDTLDKVDPAQLRQNVAAWTATLAILANSSDSELDRKSVV